MRIGIFGGSFDPIHSGHLILAERCREDAGLDQVWFVPCAQNPLKDQGPRATDRQRTEMIDLALSGHEPFVLSRVEIERGGPSYMIDTLTTISENRPDDELFLLLGDDSLETFPQWKDPQGICRLATPLVVNRPGSDQVDLTVLEPYFDAVTMDQVRSSQIDSPLIEISSTDIRERTAAGHSIRFLTPRSVEKYIETQKLYVA